MWLKHQSNLSMNKTEKNAYKQNIRLCQNEWMVMVMTMMIDYNKSDDGGFDEIPRLDFFLLVCTVLNVHLNDYELMFAFSACFCEYKTLIFLLSGPITNVLLNKSNKWVVRAACTCSKLSAQSKLNQACMMQNNWLQTCTNVTIQLETINMDYCLD